MIRFFLRFLFVAVSFLWVPHQALAEIMVTDDTGANIKLSAPAQRIVTLAPHAAEMLFAIGAGSKIVGAVDYTDYPEEAKKIPRVGGYSRIDLEAVFVMKPDLVVAWQSGNAEGAIEKLKKLGLTVYTSEPRQLEDVASNMERLGRLVGEDTMAKKAAADYISKLNQLRDRYKEKSRVRVFYQIWNKPLMTLNGEHLIGRVIRLCGGENIFADLPTLAPQVDLEAVLSADPEAIIGSGMAAKRPEWLAEWERWPNLAAVKLESIYTIDSDIIQRHSPRIVEGAAVMCEHLEKTRRKRGG